MNNLACRELASRCFQDFDSGRKGHLNKEDLQCALSALLGFEPTTAELRQWIGAEELETGGKTAEIRMTEAEFVEFSASRMRSMDQDEVVRQMFQAFDQKCKGFLTREDFHSVFKEVCPVVANDMIDDAFSEVAADGRTVTFRDFWKAVSRG